MSLFRNRLMKAEPAKREFVRKGLYEVFRIAFLIQELAYLRGCCGESVLVEGLIPAGSYLNDVSPAMPAPPYSY